MSRIACTCRVAESDRVERVVGRPHAEEGRGLAGCDQLVDHQRQRRIGQSVAVMGEEILLALEIWLDPAQALANA